MDVFMWSMPYCKRSFSEWPASRVNFIIKFSFYTLIFAHNVTLHLPDGVKFVS
jgi:hypothetical protein